MTTQALPSTTSVTLSSLKKLMFLVMGMTKVTMKKSSKLTSKELMVLVAGKEACS